MALFGIGILLIAAAAAKVFPSFTVRVRDDATLPCGNLTKDQQSCDNTSWLYRRDSQKEKLVKNGQIRKNIPKDKGKRLNVLANCSLVIKNVTEEDYGLYNCTHHKQNAPVSLSVVNVDSYGPDMFYCSVLTYSGCWHSVQWMYKGSQEDIITYPRTCSAEVLFKTPHPHQESNTEELLFCNVKDNRSGQTLLFNVPPSGGEETKDKNLTLPARLLGLIVAAVVLVILIIVLVFIRWRKAQGNQTQRDDDTGQSKNPAETRPSRETSQESADPDDGVAYVSVNFTRKRNGNSEAPAGDDDDDDDDGSVTYTTVKVSSSDDGASVNPSSRHATVYNPDAGQKS